MAINVILWCAASDALQQNGLAPKRRQKAPVSFLSCANWAATGGHGQEAWISTTGPVVSRQKSTPYLSSTRISAALVISLQPNALWFIGVCLISVGRPFHHVECFQCVSSISQGYQPADDLRVRVLFCVLMKQRIPCCLFIWLKWQSILKVVKLSTKKTDVPNKQALPRWNEPFKQFNHVQPSSVHLLNLLSSYETHLLIVGYFPSISSSNYLEAASESGGTFSLSCLFPAFGMRAKFPQNYYQYLVS